MNLSKRSFKPKLKKIKNMRPEKNSLLFQEMETFSSNIKKIITFSQKKAFIIFPEMEPRLFKPKL